MRAKRSLGQNFLIDPAISSRIVDAVRPGPDDRIVEIGPGQGSLTALLVDRVRTVIAIEFDRDLLPVLAERFRSYANLQVLNQDALSVDFDLLFADVLPDRTKLVANLPYNISTPILQRLIEKRHLFASFVLMFQREVVERISAGPGGSDRGFLSVLVENAFEIEKLFDVPPGAFRPVPKVWSSVVRLTPRPNTVEDGAELRRLLSAAFAQKRKTILNNLKAIAPDASAILDSAMIDPQRRAETLTIIEWSALVEAIKKPGRP